MKSVLKTAAIFGLMVCASMGSAWAQSRRGTDSGLCRSYYRYSGFGTNRPLQILGLTTDQRLICFNENGPQDVRTIGIITGLTSDLRIVGMDYRPSTDELYGLGNAGGIYKLDPATAKVISRQQLSVGLIGNTFGVDFNPVVDRLRIVSDLGQNLRVNVDTGAAIVDANLTYTPPPTAPSVTATNIVAAAYTNNDTDAGTATTLYVVDSALDQLVIQSPANSGILVANGKLGADTTDFVGFDIYSTVRNGAAVELEAFASLTIGNRTELFSINLFNGKAQSRGPFRTGDSLIDITIPPNQP